MEADNLLTLSESSFVDIPEYEGLYKVNKLGEIFSIISNRKLKPNKGKAGYFRICLQKDKKSKFYFIHRIIGIVFIPNPKNKPQINHIDGDTTNNSIRNLEWVTASENGIHAHMFLPRKKNSYTKKRNFFCMDTITGKIFECHGVKETASVLNIPFLAIAKALSKRRRRVGKYLFSKDLDFSYGMSKPAKRKGNSNRKGKKQSEESKELYHYKKCFQYNSDGVFLNEFKSVRQAQSDTGINESKIAMCARGASVTAGGYRWSYIKYSFLDKVKLKSEVTSERRSKKIIQMDLSGVIIAEWKSATEASKVLGIDRGSISNCVCGKLKAHKGFKWAAA